MQAGGSLALAGDPGEAAGQVAREAIQALGGAAPDFGLLFASPHFLATAGELIAALTAVTGPVPLIGCVAAAITGGGREIESGPAVSLLLAAGAGEVESYSMEFVRTDSGGAYGGYLMGPGAHLMICDPFSFPPGALLTHLNSSVPGAIVAGGLASGGAAREQSRLFLDGKVLPQGAVGIYLPGVPMLPLVSQGCRPVGEPYTVTSARASIILELGGKPPLTRLHELAGELPERDAELLVSGPQVGLVMDEYRADHGPGDFLIRGIVAADPQSGALAIADEVEVGQTLQFHIRDAESADADLRAALRGSAAATAGSPVAGGVLFTCSARGSALFAKPDHDSGLIAEEYGDIPVAGFACAGELGSVAGRNFLHTFTASVALFPA